MTACTYAMNELRKTYSQVKNDIFLNHHYYSKINGSLCKMVVVKLLDLNKRLSTRKTRTEQIVIPCYGRTFTLNAEIPAKDAHNFQRILMYPTDENYTSWLVFEYDMVTKTYVLIRWYHMTPIMYNLIPTDLLMFPPPTELTETSPIYAALLPFISTWYHLHM